MIDSSFRDPSGYLFIDHGNIYRHINPCYEKTYNKLMENGLYDKLTNEHLIIPHIEIKNNLINPEIIPFISYPYEWCFSQLKDAALTTLRIQEVALGYGMILKDASSYNIQFKSGKPVLIDTLSFETYQDGSPWVAYRQFCQHFLNPLALMSYKDIRLGQLLKTYIDGIPMDLASRLIPIKANFNLPLLAHIKLHASSQKHIHKKTLRMSKFNLTCLIKNLETTISKLKWNPKGGWSNYKKIQNYSEVSINHKNKIFTEFIEKIKPETVWDLGCNLGFYSKLSKKLGANTVVSIDNDPACVELAYRLSEGNYLPLLVDMINPSPGIGWENKERLSFLERGKPNLIISLALIHHLAIGNNLPLSRIAKFMKNTGEFLIIEFIPKDDSQVQKMLSTRPDIFPNYNQSSFEEEFGKYFEILQHQEIQGSKRSIYLMERND